MADNLHDSAAATPPTLPGVLIADHYHKPYGYETYRPYGTKDWLLTYTKAGVGCYRIGGSRIACGPYRLAVLKPGTLHHYYTKGEAPWDFYWAHFVPRTSWHDWLKLPETSPGILMLDIEAEDTRDRIENTFARLIRDSRDTRALQAELALNALEEIVLLAQLTHKQSAGRTLDPRIEEVLHHMSQHYAKPLGINELAASVCLSPSRLSHLFKEQTGSSIIDTLLNIRLRQAARLLEFTSLPVSDIAYEIGFQSPGYLTRQFQAFYGTSPTRYRKQTQE